MISYDWDTSPEQRRTVPFHYGKSSVATLLICLHNSDTVLIIRLYPRQGFESRYLFPVDDVAFFFARYASHIFVRVARSDEYALADILSCRGHGTFLSLQDHEEGLLLLHQPEGDR